MNAYWLKHKSSSIGDFCDDQMIRSLDCATWINRLGGQDLETGLREGLSGTGLRRVYSALYRRIESFLLDTVWIALVGGAEPVSDMVYHRRFGWIGILRDHEVFLGKMTLENVGRLAVGPRTYFSGAQTIRGSHPVAFGAFCSVAEDLYLDSTPDFHPLSTPSTFEFCNEPRDPENRWNMDISYAEVESAPTGVSVGQVVWIGRRVRIFHGAEIGNGCVVAEGSLVRGKLEPYGVYAGVPAKLKRLRFSEKAIAALEEIQWWNWSPERIKRNKVFFATDLTKFDGDVKGLILA